VRVHIHGGGKSLTEDRQSGILELVVDTARKVVVRFRDPLENAADKGYNVGQHSNEQNSTRMNKTDESVFPLKYRS